MTDESGEDVFDDAVEAVEPAEAEAEAEETTADDAAEAEGEDDEKTEPREETVPLAALKSERQRRQELERRISELTASSRPDPRNDPEGYVQDMKIDFSVKAARRLHSDYDEVMQHYAALEAANPAIALAVAQDDAPALFAYDLVKESMRISDNDKRLSEISGDDWAKFQKWKKEQSVQNGAARSSLQDVSKLNKVSAGNKPVGTDADELFAGAAF